MNLQQNKLENQGAAWRVSWWCGEGARVHVTRPRSTREKVQGEEIDGATCQVETPFSPFSAEGKGRRGVDLGATAREWLVDQLTWIHRCPDLMSCQWILFSFSLSLLSGAAP